MKILPYKPGSRSARVLAEGLGFRRLRHENSRWRPRNNPVVINWGCCNPPEHLVDNVQWLNDPRTVNYMANKLSFMQWMNRHSQCRIPAWTTDHEVANNWGVPFMARRMLRANGGRGCEYVEPAYPYGEGGIYPVPAGYAPLYTQYVKKQDEYRVHFVGNQVIHVQQKRKRLEEPANFKVRNHHNGWVFTIQNVQPPDDVIAQACMAFRDSMLTFGAVDVIWNNHYQQAYVLEINTAPGLEGTTAERYIEGIRNYLQENVR